MDSDDDRPTPNARSKKTLLTPANLVPLSVVELDAYIVELEAEITRVRVDIKTKTAQRSAAEALFKN
ncbi:MAG: DUF1192 domain-containing protein [Alphaproteobacteria bacterium]